MESKITYLLLIILIFIGFLWALIFIMRKRDVREIFSAGNGQLSSVRFMSFIVVIVILSNWTYFNVMTNTFNPLSGDLLMALIAAIYGPVAQLGFAGKNIKSMTEFESVLDRNDEKEAKRERLERGCSNKKIEKVENVKPTNLE